MLGLTPLRSCTALLLYEERLRKNNKLRISGKHVSAGALLDAASARRGVRDAHAARQRRVAMHSVVLIVVQLPARCHRSVEIFRIACKVANDILARGVVIRAVLPATTASQDAFVVVK